MFEPFLEKKFDIKTYEGDKNGDLRIITLMNLFQDAADSHASALNVGLEHCLRGGLAWVGSAYHIKINKLPKLHEEITIKTWPSIKNKLTAIREFEVANEKGGKLILASSQWVLLNVEKKRPVSLDDNLPDFPNTPTRAVETDFPKITEVTEHNFDKHFYVRFDDIDINDHVNNAIYPLWATESVKDQFRLGHTPKEIEIAFKKEGLFGEMIRVNTLMEEKLSNHSVRGNDDRELARVRILWAENKVD
ncbi:MAG: hypothetical protein LBL47_01605 [Lactobacillus sp.]|jgi:acyl-ACP thioesterase|nr:hypothetical protein [Lactobacillus sp.]